MQSNRLHQNYYPPEITLASLEKANLYTNIPMPKTLEILAHVLK
jgi:hypothetical protein